MVLATLDRQEVDRFAREKVPWLPLTARGGQGIMCLRECNESRFGRCRRDPLCSLCFEQWCDAFVVRRVVWTTEAEGVLAGFRGDGQGALGGPVPGRVLPGWTSA